MASSALRLWRQWEGIRRVPLTRALSSSATRSSNKPWFMETETEVPKAFALRSNPPHLLQKTPVALPPLPDEAPQPLKDLHAELKHSPLLEPATLIVTQPSAPPPGPPLPFKLPQGRRRRGGTYAGESAYDDIGGLWSWVLMAQVKEGTESRGAIESVIRTVRKSLLQVQPPLPLPPNSKKRLHHGWAMIDGGSFAVHILSKEAREKYFSW
ncbi:hypothetical protein AX16_003627 [Volvariella volvacea WC 439]|nr:hypothetical protein AX16_003627 [Volvariella volvacea WC 439]